MYSMQQILSTPATVLELIGVSNFTPDKTLYPTNIAMLH